MDTFRTLLQLSSITSSKSDYLDLVEVELNTSQQTLQKAGYKVNIEIGLVGQQSMNRIDDLLHFQHFRDLLFIYHGLKNNNWSNDPFEDRYFIGLKGFVTNQYSSLP